METEPQKESSLDSQLSAGGCSSWSCPALKRTVREGEINLCSAQTRRSGAVCCGSIWWPLPTNTPWLSLGNFQALLCSEMGSGLLMLSVSRDDTPAFLLHLKLYPNREPPQGPLAWTLATLFPAQGLLPGCTRAATRISPHPPASGSHACPRRTSPRVRTPAWSLAAGCTCGFIWDSLRGLPAPHTLGAPGPRVGSGLAARAR